MVRTSSKWGKIWLWSYIWPWRSRSFIPKNNRDINLGVLHLWSKFNYPSLKVQWVIVRTSSWLTHTHKHTNIQTHRLSRWQSPKLASGKKAIRKDYFFLRKNSFSYDFDKSNLFNYLKLKANSLNSRNLVNTCRRWEKVSFTCLCIRFQRFLPGLPPKTSRLLHPSSQMEW